VFVKRLIFLILILFFGCFQTFAEFNPFPLNEGTIYEYTDEDVENIENFFFPVDKAHWDGSIITAKEWKLFTDFQKSVFISEYVEVLEKEYRKTIDINEWEYLIALNGFVGGCEEGCLDASIVRVIKDLLTEQEKLK